LASNFGLLSPFAFQKTNDLVLSLPWRLIYFRFYKLFSPAVEFRLVNYLALRGAETVVSTPLSIFTSLLFIYLIYMFIITSQFNRAAANE